MDCAIPLASGFEQMRGERRRKKERGRPSQYLFSPLAFHHCRYCGRIEARYGAEKRLDLSSPYAHNLVIAFGLYSVWKMRTNPNLKARAMGFLNNHRQFVFLGGGQLLSASTAHTCCIIPRESICTLGKGKNGEREGRAWRGRRGISQRALQPPEFIVSTSSSAASFCTTYKERLAKICSLVLAGSTTLPFPLLLSLLRQILPEYRLSHISS